MLSVWSTSAKPLSTRSSPVPSVVPPGPVHLAARLLVCHGLRLPLERRAVRVLVQPGLRELLTEYDKDPEQYTSDAERQWELEKKILLWGYRRFAGQCKANSYTVAVRTA